MAPDENRCTITKPAGESPLSRKHIVVKSANTPAILAEIHSLSLKNSTYTS